MASSSGIVFPESMVDFLANPVNIWFDSMLAESTAPATCLIIESTAVTSNQQVKSDLMAETHPPTPCHLITGLDRVRIMLSDTIKVCECAKCPRRTSPPPTHMARRTSRHMRKQIQVDSELNTAPRGNCRGPLDVPCPVHEKSKHTTRQSRVLKKLRLPSAATHDHQIGCTLSLDCGTFQILRIIISPTTLVMPLRL
jgi:hypothetical protein